MADEHFKTIANWMHACLVEEALTKAMHSGKRFGIRYNFAKLYCLLRKKNVEYFGTFLTHVERPKGQVDGWNIKNSSIIFHIFNLKMAQFNQSGQKWL